MIHRPHVLRRSFPALLFGLLVPVVPSAYALNPFQESSGQVVMEAENFDSKVARSGQDWVAETSQAGYAGSGYRRAMPNNNVNINTGYVTTSPELVYKVKFSTPGTYYVWIRGHASTTSDDSVHVGIDGTGPATSDRMGDFPAAWTWLQTTLDGPVATLTVPNAGVHTIHVWMRQDGLRVDRILLRTSSSSTAPSGTGPAESPRVAVDTTPPVVTITSPANNSIYVQ